MGCPLITFRFSMAPFLLMVACNCPEPEMRAARAMGGYCGVTLLISKPVATPEDTRIFWGVATLGGGVFMALNTLPITPPGTPPATPPGTPMLVEGAGVSSSTILTTLLGILVGVRSAPSTILLCTCLITTVAGGGGGGGGGGGATRKVVRDARGSASV